MQLLKVRLKQIMDFFIKTIELFLTLLEGSLRLLLNGLVSIVEGSGGNKKYDARFSSGNNVLSWFNKGFCLTGTKNLSIKKSCENAMLIGSTGAGKSSVSLITSLYTTDGSFVINDPSGELYNRTAAALKMRGYDIKILNFAKPHISSFYNPLTRANTTSEIMKFSKLTIEGSLGGSKEQFWNL
jgi:type IV secretory pathway TraG/TraD family ATPase VirD4